MNTQTKYFLVAVVLIGSIGIWLPIGLEALVSKKVTLHNIPSNITTYFVSLLFAGCIDYFLNQIQTLNPVGATKVFFKVIGIGILGFVLVTGAVLLNVYNWDYCALLLGGIGTVIAYRVWWIANVGNPAFHPGDAPLGGNPNNRLANG